MPKEIELGDGRILEATAVLEAMDMLGCSADDLDYWLEHGWLRHHACELCGTAWPLLDDVVAIMHLAEKYPKVGLNELVHKLHIENGRETRQRQLERRAAASLAQTQRQVDRNTDPRVDPRRGGQGPYRAERQDTRRLRAEEIAAAHSYVAFEAEIPDEYEYEDRSRSKVLPEQPERRGLFGRRRSRS